MWKSALLSHASKIARKGALRWLFSALQDFSIFLDRCRISEQLFSPPSPFIRPNITPPILNPSSTRLHSIASTPLLLIHPLMLHVQASASLSVYLHHARIALSCGSCSATPSVCFAVWTSTNQCPGGSGRKWFPRNQLPNTEHWWGTRRIAPTLSIWSLASAIIASRFQRVNSDWYHYSGPCALLRCALWEGDDAGCDQRCGIRYQHWQRDRRKYVAGAQETARFCHRRSLWQYLLNHLHHLGAQSQNIQR